MRNIFLMVGLLLCTILAMAQTRTISGRVLDNQGNPVPFATITEVGTNRGTSADANGNFSITVAPGARLNITSTGFNSQTVDASGNLSDLRLTAMENALTEAIVTGAFNTKRTSRSTSFNAQVVGATQLNVIRQTSVNNALAGKVAGLQVRSQSAAALGRSSGIRLRGAGGLGGGEDAIYVVDGTILPNADDINLDDIQDVTVLQGPAASALFGSQGANGAIVMTLKRGTARTGVEVNLGATFDRISMLPNYQNAYAGGAASDLARYTWQPTHPQEWKALDGKYYHDYSDDASWGPRMLGQEYIPWYAWYGGHSRSFKTASLTPQPDNARDFFNTGINLNNSVAFTKSTEGMNLRFSYGNIDVKGILPTSSLRKNTFNLNTSLDLSEHFTVGANINYITQTVRGDIDDEYSNQSTGSFNQWFHRDLDMGIMRELKDLRTPSGIYASWNKANPTSYDPGNERGFYAGNYWYNFYTWFDLVSNVAHRDRLFGDVSLTYKITPDLRIRGTYRKQQNTTWFEEKFNSDLNESGLQTTGNAPQAKGYYGTGESYSNRQNVDFLATYSKKISDFQLNLNAGTDFFRSVLKSNAANTNNGLNVPNLFTVSNSKDQASISNNRIEEKYRAVFGRGDLGFRNFAFVDVTLRQDWYSTLPANDNAILSKSFGASFVFSDLIKVPAISFAKIRASWGEIPKSLGTNSTNFGAYRYPGSAYGVGQFQWNGNFLMSTPDQLVDSAISGAVVTQKEIGLDMRFLNNRLGFSATYWDGTEKGFPFPVATNGASGFTTKLLNTGEITKKGFEVQLNVKPLWLEKFKWEINATYGRLLENKVVSIAEGVPRASIETIWRDNAPSFVQQEGMQWGQIYGGGIKRINGQPVLDASGFYEAESNTFFGSVLPKYTGGVQNSFEFLNGFILNVNVDYQSGGKFFSLSDMWGSYSGLTARTATVNDKGNPIRDRVADGGGMHVYGVDKDAKPVDYYVEAQDYFHNLYNRKVYDEFVYDLTFVKVREVSLGYSIPVDRFGLNKLINRATFTLVARNPFLIYAKTKDLDPAEVSRIGGEAGQFPGTRGLGFNLRVGF